MEKVNENLSIEQLYKIQGYLQCLEHLYMFKGDSSNRIFFCHELVVLETNFAESTQGEDWGLYVVTLIKDIFKIYSVDKNVAYHDLNRVDDISSIYLSIADNLIEMIHTFLVLKGGRWKAYSSKTTSRIYFRQLETNDFYAFFQYVSD